MAETYMTGQVAEYCGVAEARIASLIRRGKITPPKPGPDRKRRWTKEQREKVREVVGKNS